MTDDTSQKNPEVMSATAKKWLVGGAFSLFSILLIGGFYLLGGGLGDTVNFTFAYVVGLSMIVLPCTLPLAFIIVPLAMGKGPKKGFLMALFFGLGLSITLSIYGLAVAVVGKMIGLDAAVGGASTLSKSLFVIGGLAAFIFGLSELDLIKFKLPTYGGSYPKIITKQGDYLKAFFLGLFLGNAGVGCPNPLFYILLADIAVLGNVFQGWLLGFVHGVGRATPLIFLSILGLLGVNAVANISTKTGIVKKATGISLILLGAFIFISGTSHQWYESTGIHQGWNSVVEFVTGEDSGIAEIEGDAPVVEVHEEAPGTPADHDEPVATEEADDHAEGEMKDWIPSPWSWITLLAMSIIPIWWYYSRENKAKKEKKEEEKKDEQ